MTHRFRFWSWFWLAVSLFVLMLWCVARDHMELAFAALVVMVFCCVAAGRVLLDFGSHP